MSIIKRFLDAENISHHKLVISNGIFCGPSLTFKKSIYFFILLSSLFSYLKKIRNFNFKKRPYFLGETLLFYTVRNKVAYLTTSFLKVGWGKAKM